MKNFIKKWGVVMAVCIIILGAGVPSITMAQLPSGGTPPAVSGGTPPPSSGINQTIKIDNPLACGNSCDLIAFLNLLLNNVVMPLAAVAAVLFIIWAGFKYVTAQGNPGKIKEANARLLWALIGTGVLLGAAGISQVIQATVNSLK